MASQLGDLFSRIAEWFNGNPKPPKELTLEEKLKAAIDNAKEVHGTLLENAATVIGQRNKLSMDLDRKENELVELTKKARAAAAKAKQFFEAGDTNNANLYREMASQFAADVVVTEQDIATLKTLLQQAETASVQAKQQIQLSNLRVTRQVRSHTRLLGQLAQVQMQESIAASLGQVSALSSAASTTPTITGVEEEIRTRYARALASAEIASGSPEMHSETFENLTLASDGAERLALITADMDMPPELLASDTELRLPLAAGEIVIEEDAPSLVKGSPRKTPEWD